LVDLALCQSEGQIQREIAQCREIQLLAGAAPEWIEILPAGHVEGFDGRSFKNDKPQVIVDAFRAHPLDLPLDWEHSTEVRAPEGEEAPAAGWIKELDIRDGAIWARVEWTDRGRASVVSKEYRYVSPAILYEKGSRRVVAIVSAALTNRPNLNLPALNSGHQNPEIQMLKKLLALLSLADGITEDQALGAVKALQATAKTGAETAAKLKTEQEAREKLAQELEIANHARATPDLSLYVPRAEYEAARNANEALKADAAKADEAKVEATIEELITQAKKDTKITPASEDFYRASCRQEGGVERFREFLKIAAPIVPAAPPIPSKTPGSGTGSLSDEEVAVCSVAGNNAEELALFKTDRPAWDKMMVERAQKKAG